MIGLVSLVATVRLPMQGFEFYLRLRFLERDQPDKIQLLVQLCETLKLLHPHTSSNYLNFITIGFHPRLRPKF